MRADAALLALSLALPALLASPHPTVAGERARLRRPARGFQMRMGPFVVAPASERETCEYRTLPNRNAMDAQSFELRMSEGSHHFVVWAYLGPDHDPTHFPDKMVDSPGCIGVGPPDAFNRANLFGMQTSRGRVRFPKGIAVRLAPQQPVLLNAHYKNASLTDPLAPSLVFNIVPARRGSVKHHAESLVVGNIPDISIPPRGHGSLTAEWRAPIALNVIQLSSHQHKRGTGVTIHRLDAAGNDLGEVYATQDWQHPLEVWHADPPMRIPQGEGFRFTCEWENPDDKQVRFGVTTDDEMCFMTGYFYRDDESAPLPRAPGCFPQGAGLLCPLARAVR